MKKGLKGFFSILLALLICFSSLGPVGNVFAADDEEIVCVTDEVELSPEIPPEFEEDEIECEVEPFEEGDEESPELSEEMLTYNLNIADGADEGEFGVVEDEVPDPTDDSTDYIEITHEAPFEDESGIMSEEFELEEENGSIETALAVAYLDPEKNSISLNEYSTQTVRVSIHEILGKVKYKCTSDSGAIRISHSRSGSIITIKIYGNYVGSANIKIQLYDASNNKEIVNGAIKATVKKNNYITANASNVGVKSGEICTVRLNPVGGSYLTSSKSGNSCEYSISKQFLGYCLAIQGTNVGTSKITVYLKNNRGTTLDSVIIKVNTSRNATLYPSKNNFSLDIGASTTVSFSSKNAYGNLSIKASNNSGNCAISVAKKEITITGKNAGTASIPVSLYDSNNNFLASTTVNVTIKSNPKLNISNGVSTINLKPAGTSTVRFNMTGYSGAVSAKYSINNKSICGAAWSSSWVNNGISLKVYAYKGGNTAITVNLYKSGTNTKLCSCKLNVTVSGNPSIYVSSSSVSVDMGSKKNIEVAPKNVATNYKLSYKREGGCFTADFTRIGNTYYCAVKGEIDGEGIITIYLKSEDGTVLDSKTIRVKVNWVENPGISQTKSEVTFVEGGSGVVSFFGHGTRKKVHFVIGTTQTNLGSSVKVTYQASSLGLDLKFSCDGLCKKVYKISMVDSSGNTLASSNVTVRTSANTAERFNYAYSFKNFSSWIPLSSFYAVFGVNTRATRLYLKESNQGGVCYGMAATSLIMNCYNNIKPSSFGKSSISSLSLKDKCDSLNINVRRFIEMMQISQESTMAVNSLVWDLNKLCSAVKAGSKVRVKIYGHGNGHALLAYRLDDINNLLYIYDPNYKNEVRSITLTKSGNVYTGWSYNLNDNDMFWSSSNGYRIAYQTAAIVNNQWMNFGGLDISSTFLDNYTVEELNPGNILITNSDEFNIYDVEKNVIASYSNGVLTTVKEDVNMYIPDTVCLDIDGTVINKENEYNYFYLPTNFYVLENEDESVDLFEAEMLALDYGASIKTEANQVAFGIDDSCDLCTTSLSLEKGDSFDVTLLSSREGESNKHLDGNANNGEVELGLSLIEGELSIDSNGNNSVEINGADTSYVAITASSNTGGSISDEGVNSVIAGTNKTFNIVPDDGYSIADVLVNGESVGSIGKYSFISVENDAVIEAQFIPRNLNVSSIRVDNNGLNVVLWSPVPLADGFEIYRKSAQHDWKKIGDVESSTLDFTDTEITTSFTDYSYSVKAYAINEEGKDYGSFDETGSKYEPHTHNYSVVYEWEQRDGKMYCDATATCDCGEVTITESILATGSVKTPATCTKKGTTTYTAEFLVNTDVFTTQTTDYEDIALIDHSYEWRNNEDATISADGTRTQICMECGAEGITETVIGSKLNGKLKIKGYTPVLSKIDYKSSLEFNVEGTVPAGYTVKWSNGQTGTTCKIQSATNSEYNIYCWLEKDGVIVDDTVSDAVAVTVNTGFFAKLIAFFRGLFKALPKWVDNTRVK